MNGNFKRALDRANPAVTIAQLMKSFQPILILSAIFFCVPLSRAELVDGVVAVVSDTIITRQQVDDFAAPAIDTLRQRYANEPDTYQQELSKTLNDSLETLVERQLILH